MKPRILLSASLLASVSLLALPVQAQSSADTRRACESFASNPSQGNAQNLFGTTVRNASDFCDDRGYSLAGGFDDDWRDDRGAGYAVEMTIAGGPATDGFVAASDRVSAGTDAYLDSVGAGAPLGPDEEAERFGRR